MGIEVKDELAVKQLWVGTYVASAMAPASGYVIIKTETGASRKYLVY